MVLTINCTPKLNGNGTFLQIPESMRPGCRQLQVTSKKKKKIVFHQFVKISKFPVHTRLIRMFIIYLPAPLFFSFRASSIENMMLAYLDTQYKQAGNCSVGFALARFNLANLYRSDATITILLDAVFFSKAKSIDVLELYINTAIYYLGNAGYYQCNVGEVGGYISPIFIFSKLVYL